MTTINDISKAIQEEANKLVILTTQCTNIINKVNMAILDTADNFILKICEKYIAVNVDTRIPNCLPPVITIRQLGFYTLPIQPNVIVNNMIYLERNIARQITQLLKYQVEIINAYIQGRKYLMSDTTKEYTNTTYSKLIMIDSSIVKINSKMYETKKQIQNYMIILNNTYNTFCKYKMMKTVKPKTN